MINLLPQHQQKQLRRTLLLRTSVLALLCILALLVIMFLLIAPSVYMLWSRNAVLTTELESRKQNMPNTMQFTQDAIAALERDLGILRTNSGSTTPTALVTALTGVREQDITLWGFVFDREKKTLDVRGYAETRNALTGYRAAVRALPFVQSADVPTSLLVNERNIDFTLRIVLKPDTP